MPKKTFIYIQQYKVTDWYEINACLRRELSLWQDSGKDFEVVIGPKVKERGEQALKAYWVLIGVVKIWMDAQGNNYTKEEISDYFKHAAKHIKNVKGIAITKSIAKNSGCTFEQMQRLIEYILQFGHDNNIIGCEIEPREWKEFKNYYEVRNNTNS